LGAKLNSHKPLHHNSDTIPRSVAQARIKIYLVYLNSWAQVNNFGFGPAVYVLSFRIYDAPTAPIRRAEEQQLLFRAKNIEQY